MTNTNPIKVKDNRLFNADGSLRESSDHAETQSTPIAAAAPKSQEPQRQASPTPEPQPAPGPQHDSNYPGEIDFQTFMLSLASSAQISMGIVPNPITGQSARDLTHAKQTLDILGMLEQKTKNNLTPEESGLLKNILFQLRMQFVELAKHAKQAL